jgi:hypothetical protein
MTYQPQEKLTIWQALYAYTQGSAYAEFSDPWKGKLAPGYVADFVILDRDLTTIAPREILKTVVLRTVVAGRTVYESSVHTTGGVHKDRSSQSGDNLLPRFHASGTIITRTFSYR